MPDAPVPPVAQAIPTHHAIHGETRVDPYRWLHDKESADTRAYLEAENAYADAMLADTEPLRDAVYAEMLGRIQETDLSVPYPMGGFTYYTRTEEGKQYPIHCRKAAGSDVEQVLLDVNALAEGEKFLSIGTMSVSDDGRLLAYSTDRTGFREYTLRIKDLETGALLPDTIEKVGSVAWAADNRTLFHTAEDAAKRPDRVLRHVLGSTEPDPVVHAEPDALYRVFLYRSRDRKVIFVGSASSTTTEVHAIPADAPESAPTLLLARSEGHEYYPEHREGLYYLRTNRDAVNFRIVAASVDDVSEEHWTEVLAHDPATMLEDMDLFRDHLVVTELSGGLPRLRIVSFATGEDHCATFPEPTYMAGLETNREWDTRVLRFRYASLVTPASVFSYEMETRERTLLKETPVLGGYDRSMYVSEYVHAVATDGTRVPISLVRHRDTPVDGTAPCLLYGYGSYGIVMPAGFNPSRLSLLDRGFVYAIAHIRGGGEMGKPWHDDGKLGKKMNTFTDFIACADHLVSEGYADRGKLAIMGGSAGGLLMGAVTNLRPDVAKVVMSYVPFVDVINTMLDDTLPLTVGEYLEWGNPNEEEAYRTMVAYSPYDNLREMDYPTTLIRTSLNDSQVMYWEPAKYVARMRTVKTDANPLLLRTNMDAGHGGASGRYDALRDLAADYAFLFTTFGLAG